MCRKRFIAVHKNRKENTYFARNVQIQGDRHVVIIFLGHSSQRTGAVPGSPGSDPAAAPVLDPARLRVRVTRIPAVVLASPSGRVAQAVPARRGRAGAGWHGPAVPGP